MTKKELLQKIDNIDPSQFDLVEFEDAGYGDPGFLGEYALPGYLLLDETGIEWEFLKEDFDQLGLKFFEDFTADTYSSKSGTGFNLIKFQNPGYDDQLWNLQSCINENSSYRELQRTWNEIVDIKRSFEKDKEAIQAEIEKAEEWITGIAIGKRSGCFSNGEVVFTPIKGNRAGYNQLFPPYYNPNEELVAA